MVFSEFILTGAGLWFLFFIASYLLLLRPLKNGLEPNNIAFIALAVVNYWIGYVVGGVIYTLAYFMVRRGRLDTQQISHDNIGSIYKLVSKDEALIINALVRLGGRCRQSELTAVTGMGKVKMYRLLRRLSSREVVKIQKGDDGRNFVVLDPALLDILREKLSN